VVKKFWWLCLFVLTEFTNVTDTHTDTHTPHDDMGHVCIASRGKNRPSAKTFSSLSRVHNITDRRQKANVTYSNSLDTRQMCLCLSGIHQVAAPCCEVDCVDQAGTWRSWMTAYSSQRVESGRASRLHSNVSTTAMAAVSSSSTCLALWTSLFTYWWRRRPLHSEHALLTSITTDRCVLNKQKQKLYLHRNKSNSVNMSLEKT